MSAIAHTQQAISRAVAQFSTHGIFPAWDMASRLSSRRRLHIGTCHDAATSAHRTWELPARVIPPRDSVSPLERSEGARPHHAANDGALGC